MLRLGGILFQKKKFFFEGGPQNVTFSCYLLLKRFHRVRFLGGEIKKNDEIMTIFQILALYDH